MYQDDPGGKKNSPATSEKTKNGVLGSLGILGVLAFKFKLYIFAGLKALTFLKVGWLLSPLLSIGFYALLFGWPYAFAIMLLLFVHEMGHWIWMKALHLEPKAPVFIPGLGAYVAMTKLPPDQTTHAWVALAGPLVGGVGSAALFWGGINTDNHWMTAAGSTGFFLNLLQLVPAKPLDGGFVIQAVSRWLLVPGTGILFAVSVAFKSPLLLIISVISLFSLVSDFMRRNRGAGSTSYGGSSNVATLPGGMQLQTPASAPQRVIIATAYLGLAGMLGYLYWLSTNALISFVPHGH
jgi:Zn-dependent protease